MRDQLLALVDTHIQQGLDFLGEVHVECVAFSPFGIVASLVGLLQVRMILVPPCLAGGDGDTCRCLPAALLSLMMVFSVGKSRDGCMQRPSDCMRSSAAVAAILSNLGPCEIDHGMEALALAVLRIRQHLALL